MTRLMVVWICAVVANLLGWILPVIADDNRVYRGVHAFRVALSPIWPYEQFRMPAGYLVWLSVASALTNLLFVAAAAFLWPKVARGMSGSRVAVFALGAAALLNLHWTFTMEESAADLAVGYYVWVLSFVLLLLVAHPALSPRRRAGAG
jgi:hypothetical protein